MHTLAPPAMFSAVVYKTQAALKPSLGIGIDPSDLSNWLQWAKVSTRHIFTAATIQASRYPEAISADDVTFIWQRAEAILAVPDENVTKIVVAIRLFYEIVGRIEAIAEHNNLHLLIELPDSLRFLNECQSSTTSAP